MPGQQPVVERVCIDYDGRDVRTEPVVELVQKHLGEAALTIVPDLDSADALIVVGGDGGLVTSLRRNNYTQKPVIGINAGTVGFIMETERTDDAIVQMAHNLADQNFDIYPLTMLEVTTVDGARLHRAANEVSIERAKGQSLHAAYQIGKRALFSHFVGDGLILATPMGSTAYASSAQGPFVDDEVHAWVLAHSNPHPNATTDVLKRPAVMSPNKSVRISLQNYEWRPWQVNVDGETLEDWPQDETELIVRVSPDHFVHMIRDRQFDYFEKVRRAFNGDSVVEPE